jgi:class 3 adenylate cyclase
MYWSSRLLTCFFRLPSKFENYASQIVSVARETADNSFEAVEAFSVTVSSYAVDANKTWPFVDVPDWSARGQRLAALTGASRVILCPIVEDEKRQDWESHARNNAASWYQNSIENEDLEDPAGFFQDKTSLKIVPTAETNPGPWLVGWQQYPLDKRLLVTNFDMLYGKNANAYLITAATLEPAIGFFVILESLIIQPIFEKVDNGKNERKLVGIILLAVDWISYFQNVLSASTKAGVIVVMKNSCQEDDGFTYRINGPEAVYVGKGDLHDPQYDHLQVSALFVSFGYDKSKIPADRCAPELSLHLYPTQTLEASFHTKKAIHYTVVVVLIFAFTSLVFVRYDYFVNRRQQKLLERVIKQDCDNPEIFSAAPLAELYPSVTVVFADIAGFTTWSSAREPPQVFMLLERIYGAFDKIAHHHGVFKVETVGDCYVAVAGLPEPNDDHVLAVAKFARDCLHKMKELTLKLEVILGPDTTDLELRVGINSGQVTAGVLHGERSPFQLFGDCVNTAARMKSTSKRSHIQISSQTAYLLMKQGRASWVKARGEAVAANGKRKMQTFWLRPRGESALISKKNNRTITESRAIEKAPICESDSGGDFVDLDSDIDEEDDVSVPLEEILTKTQRLVV